MKSKSIFLLLPSNLHLRDGIAIFMKRAAQLFDLMACGRISAGQYSQQTHDVGFIILNV